MKDNASIQPIQRKSQRPSDIALLISAEPDINWINQWCINELDQFIKQVILISAQKNEWLLR
ncbi:MAG: hypothetical protein HQK75_16615 [Candidatus Magnetomorum sp.]|nr:hypothetical protein [Candidatus Magnetomorum sp.]